MLELSPPDPSFIGKVKISNLPQAKDSLGLRSNEVDGKRLAFVHRKQDRFTFTIRYLYANKGKTGKTYHKWRTLNVFSAVLSEKGKLNLFFSGHSVGGPKFYSSGVLNFNRNAFLVSAIYNDSNNLMNTLISQEIEALYTRMGLSAGAFSEGDRTLNLLKLTYPGWDATLYKKNRSSYVDRYTKPPLFAADIFRLKNPKEIANLLFEKNDIMLEKEFLSDSSKFMNTQIILFLMLAKKRITPAQKQALLFKLWEKPGSSTMTEEVINSLGTSNDEEYSELTFKEMMLLRSLLKVINEEYREALIEAFIKPVTTGDLSIVRGILNLYRKTKPELSKDLNKRIIFNSSLFNQTITWKRISTALEANLTESTIDSFKTHHQTVESLIKEIASTGYVTFNEQVGIATIDFGSPKLFGNVPFPTINMSGNSVRRALTPERLLIDVAFLNISTPQRTYIYSVAKKVGVEHSLNQKSNSLKLTAEQYLSLLVGVMNDGETVLEKHKIPVTKDNLLVYTVLVFYYHKVLANGTIPAKTLKLIAMGFDPATSIYIEENKITLRDARTVKGLPLTWIQDMFAPIKQKDTVDAGF